MTDDQIARGIAVAMVPGLKMLISSLYQRGKASWKERGGALHKLRKWCGHNPTSNRDG